MTREATPPAGQAHLASNVVHFARVLRRAGLPVGTDRVQSALLALQSAGLERREDFRETLAATLIGRIEHRELFDQAFALFWRDPDLMGRMLAAMLPQVKTKQMGPSPLRENQRLAQGLFPHAKPPEQEPDPSEPMQVEAALTWSDQERLAKTDFDTMSTEEWNAARRLIAKLRLAFPPQPTRRLMPVSAARHNAHADWRATLRDMARHAGEFHGWAWRKPRERAAPLVLLADISGSMSRYSRMLLHFAHAIAQAQGQSQGSVRVESFVFGTRLTRITRLMRSKDPDLAVSQVVHAVNDWAGGTRISECLHQFNQRWARRVLPGNSTVLLVSDGLEHGDTTRLAFETERLAKGCKQLVWLNPLLRFERFEPRAAGIRAMLPHVSRFVPAHNLASLQALVHTLTSPPAPTARRGPAQPRPTPGATPGSA